MAEAAISRYRGTGRRKCSVAQVSLTNGDGKITINERKLEEYILTPSMRTHALLPLEITENARKFDVTVVVSGGGPSGQAGAIRLGIARALLKVTPEAKAILRKNGCLTRDPRMRERKKYGQPGARKRFQFSKR